MMLLNLSVQPNSKTIIGMDYALYHNFSGQPGNSPINLNLGINLTGSIQTDVGKFTAHMGGINWVDVSGMVFSSFIGYQRYSIYERWPWERNAIIYDRASNYHEYGNISRDMCFGMQPFKGLLVGGQELPGNFSFRFLYGTTPAQAIITNRIPSYTLGGKLVKEFKNQCVSFNLMDYKLFVDSIATEQAGIQMHTFAYDLIYKGIVVAAEFGRGQLYSKVQKDGWGQAGRISIKTPKKLTWAPIEVEAFYLSPQFVNFYGNFLSFNTAFVSTASLSQTGSKLGGSGGISNFSGSITDVGQVSNNRKGFSVNAWFDLGKTTKLNVGNMSSMEIQSLSSNLAFGHKINALPFSKFAPFFRKNEPCVAHMTFANYPDTLYSDTLTITAVRPTPEVDILIDDFESTIKPYNTFTEGQQAFNGTSVNYQGVSPAEKTRFYVLAGNHGPTASLFLCGMNLTSKISMGTTENYYQFATDNPSKVYFNAFVYGWGDNKAELSIEFQEDDNRDGIYQPAEEGAYTYRIPINWTGWKLVQIPLSDFDFSKGGFDAKRFKQLMFQFSGTADMWIDEITLIEIAKNE